MTLREFIIAVSLGGVPGLAVAADSTRCREQEADRIT